MSQKLKCPACGSEITLEQMIQTADLEAMHIAQAAFGEDWPLVREYLDHFRPESGKAMAVKKLLRLAREIWVMWSSRRFAHHRQEFTVGREEFRESLRITCNQVTAGLTNHNYLKKVLMAAAEKTSQRLEAELRERESRLQSGRREEFHPPGEKLSEDHAWRDELSRLGRLMRQAKTPEAKKAAKKKYREHLEGANDGS